MYGKQCSPNEQGVGSLLTVGVRRLQKGDSFNISVFSCRLLPSACGGDAQFRQARSLAQDQSELRRSGVSESLGRPQSSPWAQEEVAEACGWTGRLTKTLSILV